MCGGGRLWRGAGPTLKGKGLTSGRLRTRAHTHIYTHEGTA